MSDSGKRRRQLEIMAGLFLMILGVVLSALAIGRGTQGLVTNGAIILAGMAVLIRTGHAMTGGSNAEGNRLAAGSPARYGAYAGIVVALGSAGWGLSRFFIDNPPSTVYCLAFVIGGFLGIMLNLFTLVRSRIGWAFAISLNGTAAVVFLFGIPQVRDGLGVDTVVAAIPCIIFGAITTALVGGYEDF